MKKNKLLYIIKKNELYNNDIKIRIILIKNNIELIHII